jgi:hypothetical protein
MDLANFACNDTVRSLTSGRRPSMDATYLQGIGDVVDLYVGAATSIFVPISTISNINCAKSASIVEAWDKCLGTREDLDLDLFAGDSR